MLCYNFNFITLQVAPAAGVPNSYTNFLMTVVLKIHIYNFIDNCSFLAFQFRQNIKMHQKNHRFAFFAKIQQGY